DTCGGRGGGVPQPGEPPGSLEAAAGRADRALPPRGQTEEAPEQRPEQTPGGGEEAGGAEHHRPGAEGTADGPARIDPLEAGEGRPVDPLVGLELRGIPGQARLEVDGPGQMTLRRDVPRRSATQVEDPEVPLGEGIARVGGKSGFEGTPGGAGVAGTRGEHAEVVEGRERTGV